MLDQKNHRTFMEIVNNCLTQDGLVLLQFSGKSESVNRTYAWVEKYLFPGIVTPSAKQISTSIEGLFYIADWHDFTKDYIKTLNEWLKNFDRNWKKLKKNYDERFYRTWKFYLRCTPACLLASTQHLWQVVLGKIDSEQEYQRMC